MKRFFALTIAMVLTLSMAACSDKQTTPPSSSGSENNSVTDQQQPGSSQNQNTSTEQNGTAAATKTGVGIVITLDDSRGATEEKPARAQAEVTVCAASFEEDGKIVSVRFDVAEPGVDFDKEGALTTDLTEAIETKRQQGDAYGMKGVSGIGKEWYQQVDALEEWMVGKSAEEVLGMKTSTQNESEYADEADLTSSVTIAVGEFLDALQAAYDDAQGSRTGSTSEETENGSGAEGGSSTESQQSSTSSAN